MCCSPWGHKESDTTERLNPTTMDVTMWSPQGSAFLSLPLSRAQSFRSFFSGLYGAPTKYWVLGQNRPAP